MSKILGHSKQKQTERRQKKAWVESGSGIRGQTKLIGGVSTSRRLSFYEVVEKVVDDLL